MSTLTLCLWAVVAEDPPLQGPTMSSVALSLTAETAGLCASSAGGTEVKYGGKIGEEVTQLQTCWAETEEETGGSSAVQCSVEWSGV